MSVKRPYPRSAPCAVECRADGDQILALIGPNLAEGVHGFGDTLPEALRDLADSIDAETAFEQVPPAPPAGETAVMPSGGRVLLMVSARTARRCSAIAVGDWLYIDPATSVVTKNRWHEPFAVARQPLAAGLTRAIEVILDPGPRPRRRRKP